MNLSFDILVDLVSNAWCAGVAIDEGSACHRKGKIVPATGETFFHFAASSNNDPFSEFSGCLSVLHS